MTSPAPISIVERYWIAYGGVSALFSSRYLLLAVLILPLTWGTWSKDGWYDIVIGVLPNLLGFTLGGFAIFIGFGDERFKQSLAAPEDEAGTPSVYLEFCATFVHFILVQVVALLLAVASKGMNFGFPWPSCLAKLIPAANLVAGGVSYLCFLYALTSVLAVTFHVFRIAGMYETHQRFIADDEQPPDDPS
jgi:hypothetical protein